MLIKKSFPPGPESTVDAIMDDGFVIVDSSRVSPAGSIGMISAARLWLTNITADSLMTSLRMRIEPVPPPAKDFVTGWVGSTPRYAPETTVRSAPSFDSKIWGVVKPPAGTKRTKTQTFCPLLLPPWRRFCHPDGT